MSRQANISTLRKYSLVASAASLLLILLGVVFLILFTRPSLMGIDPGSIGAYEGKAIWLVFGGLFLLLGVVFQLIAYRWPRHLLGVLASNHTTPMRLHVEVEEDSESTQYYARLSHDVPRSNPKAWRVALWAPSRDTRDLVGCELTAVVYIDPQSSEPAVIEYADGYLWAMKGGAVPLPAQTPRAPADNNSLPARRP